ncbi:MAG TPA: hypothetical protein VFP33_10070, partial [Gallionella sp.]|nr:hypothetical protein [Gallionella sp.]
VSVGVATINKDTEDDLSIDDFIRCADNALYEAKRRGRGRTVVEPCASQANGTCRAPCPEMGCRA